MTSLAAPAADRLANPVPGTQVLFTRAAGHLALRDAIVGEGVDRCDRRGHGTTADRRSDRDGFELEVSEAGSPDVAVARPGAGVLVAALASGRVRTHETIVRGPWSPKTSSITASVAAKTVDPSPGDTALSQLVEVAVRPGVADGPLRLPRQRSR